ncbi:hypothetical protein DYB26_006868 [Aphanomyces astaci]|uniref:Uncharacterized protein n=1 Tax=Aphanomyces astaci TaxID=112090 RepID=A0A3R6Z9T0_APHAT|nr:hypothetical protein DYB26_006868 [Aphanomyces astaci]
MRFHGVLVPAMAVAAVVQGADMSSHRSLQDIVETPAVTPRPSPSPTDLPTTSAKPTTSSPPRTTAKVTPAPTEEPTDAPTEQPTTTLTPTTTVVPTTTLAPTPKPTTTLAPTPKPTTTLAPTPKPTPETTPKPTTSVPETDAPTPELTPEPTKAPKTTVSFTPPPTVKVQTTPPPTPDPIQEETTKPSSTKQPVETASGIAGWVIPTIVGGAVFFFVTALFLCTRLSRYRDSDDYGQPSVPSPYSVDPAGTYQGAPTRKAAPYLPPLNNATIMTNDSSFLQGCITPRQDLHPGDSGSIGIYDGPRTRNLSLGSFPTYDCNSLPPYDARSSGMSYDRQRHVCLDDDVENRRTRTSIPQNRITSPQGLQSYTF